MHSPDAPISTLLVDFYARIISWVERFTAGTNWQLKTFLACVLFSIFFSGGIDLNFEARGGYVASYYQKIEHPLLDVAKIYKPDSHDANLNFRLTVPVILHALHIRGYWSLPCVTVVAICLILIVSSVAGFQLTGDRVCAFFFALNVAATYVGSFAFIGYYDEIAILQLALAALPRMSWWGRGLLVLTASFTDERAFVASGFVLIACLFFYPPPTRGLARLRCPHFLAVAGAMFLYVIVRIALMALAHLSSPTGGIGVGNAVRNIPFLHPAIWYSLEGGWLFWALALGLLFARRHFVSATVILVTTICFIGFALMVGDLMRSTVYIFPLLFISAFVVSENETLVAMRSYCLAAFLISAVGGNYNVFLGKIIWFQPLLVQLLYYVAQDVYLHIYNLLPHTVPRS